MTTTHDHDRYAGLPAYFDAEQLNLDGAGLRTLALGVVEQALKDSIVTGLTPAECRTLGACLQVATASDLAAVNR